MNNGKDTVKAYATGSKTKVEDEGNKKKAHEEGREKLHMSENRNEKESKRMLVVYGRSTTTSLSLVHTDKKENQIFLIYKEILNGAVAKSYMTNGLLIYGFMHRRRILCTLQLSARCHFTGPKNISNSKAQTPPTCPRNGYARIQNIMHGDV